MYFVFRTSFWVISRRLVTVLFRQDHTHYRISERGKQSLPNSTVNKHRAKWITSAAGAQMLLAQHSHIHESDIPLCVIVFGVLIKSSSARHDNWCTGTLLTTSPMSDHKGFKLQEVSEIPPLHLQVNFQKFSTLRVMVIPEHIWTTSAFLFVRWIRIMHTPLR